MKNAIDQTVANCRCVPTAASVGFRKVTFSRFSDTDRQLWAGRVVQIGGQWADAGLHPRSAWSPINFSGSIASALNARLIMACEFRQI